jgi:hypothetical protein
MEGQVRFQPFPFFPALERCLCLIYNPLRHIILIPSQPVFPLSPYCCVLSGEATNTNFIVFCLTRPGLEPTTYSTRVEHANHYATNAVTSGNIQLSVLG